MVQNVLMILVKRRTAGNQLEIQAGHLEGGRRGPSVTLAVPPLQQARSVKHSENDGAPSLEKQFAPCLDQCNSRVPSTIKYGNATSLMHKLCTCGNQYAVVSDNNVFRQNVALMNSFL
jgi:hypothetical protein